MLQARLLAYQDAHRYRIGANSHLLPVNLPRCPINHYQRDGAMASDCANTHSSAVNFYPNDRLSEGAPQPAPAYREPPLPLEQDAWIKPYSQDNEDYYSQAGDLFRLMSDDQKNQLSNNIAGGLVFATESVQARMLEQYRKADPEYSQRVQQAMQK